MASSACAAHAASPKTTAHGIDEEKKFERARTMCMSKVSKNSTADFVSRNKRSSKFFKKRCLKGVGKRSLKETQEKVTTEPIDQLVEAFEKCRMCDSTQVAHRTNSSYTSY